MTSDRKFFRTTYTIVVLSSESPVSPDADIEDVIREMTDGDMIGEVTRDSVEEIPADLIEQELKNIGNDGSFFTMGDEEN